MTDLTQGRAGILCRCGALLPSNHTALCDNCMPTKPKQQPLGTYKVEEEDGLVYRKLRRSPTASLELLTAAEAQSMFFHQSVFRAAQQTARHEVAWLVTPLSVVIIAPAGTPDDEMRRAGDSAIASARQGKNTGSKR